MNEIYGFACVVSTLMLIFAVIIFGSVFLADFDSKWGRFLAFLFSVAMGGYSLHLITLLQQYKHLFSQ